MALEEKAVGGEEIIIRDIKTKIEFDDPLIAFDPFVDFDPLLESDIYHDESEDELDECGQRHLLHKVSKILTQSFVIRILIAAVLVGVSFSTIIHTRQGRQFEDSPTQPSPNRNYALNFPEVYPKLDIERSTEKCRVAWETLVNLPCHEVIWARNWDAGLPSWMGMPIDRLVPLVCQARCTAALDKAQKLLRSSCIGENKFAVEGFRGKFKVNLLEASPVDVIDVLMKRHSRTCRTSPKGDAERGFCMTDLEERFGIVDGIRSDGLVGLDSFLRSTDKMMKKSASRHVGMQGSGDSSESYDYWREERMHSPSRGQPTACSWCTFAWFEDKLGMWEEGQIVWDYDVLALPRFLRMWEKAGSRCAGDRFYEIYNAAIKSYQDRGLLSQGWDHGPSGDVPYLIQNGASAGDYPMLEINELLSSLKAYQNSTSSDDAVTRQRMEDVEEYITCLDTIALEVESIECYPFLDLAALLRYLLSDLDTAKMGCSKNSLYAIDNFTRKTWAACGRFPYDSKLSFLQLPPTLEAIFGRGGTIELYQSACRGADVRYGVTPCAAIYLKSGVKEWVIRKPTLLELVRETRRLITELPEMPPEPKEFDPEDWPEEDRILSGLHTSIAVMRDGVCSDCMWHEFAQRPWIEGQAIPSELDVEWIKIAHMLHEACAKVGVFRPDRELKDMDDYWKMKYSEVLWDEAFKVDQE